MLSHANSAYLQQANANLAVDSVRLGAMMALFDGHDIPAMWWEQGRRPAYYKTPWVSRRLAYISHLLGTAQVGAYPFRGVSPWKCDCAEGHHLCDGLGARYVCLDLDAHKGETDTQSRVRRLLAAAWPLGLSPLVFSSRSGKGAHVYIFFNRALPTATIAAAGRHLANLAGITSRCDVIPSAQHYKGQGTLHALPLSPLWRHRQGGILFDSVLKPVSQEQVNTYLLWALETRCQAEVIMELAAGIPTAPVGAPRSFTPPAMPAQVPVVATKADEEILKAMQKSHPQFRKALSTPPERWKGGRSVRDAYLVGYMRRQKMSPGGMVEAMMQLGGTKAAERGAEYVWALVLAQDARSLSPTAPLAGELLQPRAAKLQRRAAPWSPWDARVAPPKHYEGFQSPWWTAGVQERLQASRGLLDGIVLAHLIDRYYRGAIPRRMFFASSRGLAKQLGVRAGTVGHTVVRLQETFSDVLRHVPGVPHPRLRLAAGYYVPEHRHRDGLDWYISPGTPAGKSH